MQHRRRTGLRIQRLFSSARFYTKKAGDLQQVPEILWLAFASPLKWVLDKLKLKFYNPMHNWFPLTLLGHLMRSADSLEKTLMLGNIEGRRRRGWQRMRWLDGHEFEQALEDSEGKGSLVCCSPWGRKESDTTELNWDLTSLTSRIWPASVTSLSFCYCRLQFSSVVSDSLWSHGRQHARLPGPHHLPELDQTHVHWVDDAIQPSCLLSSPSPPAFNISQH